MDFDLEHDASLALKIDRLMRRFHADLHPRASRIDSEKVGPIGGMFLLYISENVSTTAQDISSALGRDKAQVSRVLGLLAQKGLVAKSQSEEDGRSSQLRLTESGQLQVAAFNGALMEATRSTLGHLTPEDKQSFSELLSKILEATD